MENIKLRANQIEKLNLRNNKLTMLKKPSKEHRLLNFHETSENRTHSNDFFTLLATIPEKAIKKLNLNLGLTTENSTIIIINFSKRKKYVVILRRRNCSSILKTRRFCFSSEILFHVPLIHTNTLSLITNSTLLGYQLFGIISTLTVIFRPAEMLALTSNQCRPWSPVNFASSVLLLLLTSFSVSCPMLAPYMWA